MNPTRPDEHTIVSASRSLDGTGSRWSFKRLLPFLGPAFVASVAYVDPGNFAANIQAGSEFGYLLLWVVVSSNLIAMLIQSLSAKLGLATGSNLAEHCRRHLPRPVVLCLWVLMEVVAMATDMAEFLGAALGFQILFGMPLIVGGVLTAIVTFLILSIERFGFRPMEWVISGFVGLIAVCYLIDSILDKPDWGSLALHAVSPAFAGPESVVLAAGILGATVMPHAIFLHSALMQGRIRVSDPVKMRRIFHFEIVDVVLAMGIAGFVNAAILVMAASTFHRHGLTQVATIEEAHRTLEPLLGSAARWIFGISLLASGLSSSTVGASAGQVMMQGFVKLHIPVWLRRSWPAHAARRCTCCWQFARSAPLTARPPLSLAFCRGQRATSWTWRPTRAPGM